MADYIVTLSDAEHKALLDKDELETTERLQAWIDNAIHNKARQCIDRIILRDTNKRIDLLSRTEKETIINGLP